MSIPGAEVIVGGLDSIDRSVVRLPRVASLLDLSKESASEDVRLSRDNPIVIELDTLGPRMLGL